MEILFERNMLRQGVDFVLKDKSISGEICYGRIIMEPVIECTTVDSSQIHFLTLDKAQQLMDDLWQCGLRPAEGSGSAGSMKKIEDHLADMQKIAFSCLKSLDIGKE